MLTVRSINYPIFLLGTLVKNFVKSVGLYLSHDGGFSWQKVHTYVYYNYIE